MRGTSVLIVGAGIAGPALAFWLERRGMRPTLVERAPKLRSEGYVIDFWGVGYDIVEQMGLAPELLRAGYCLREVRLVDRRGGREAGLDAGVFRTAAGGRYVSLPRGALSDILYRSIEGRVETVFDDSVTAIEDSGHDVCVHFRRGTPRRFDLVVGADGLHSVVRRLAFGPEQRFETFLGYTVGAFEVAGYPHRDDEIYVAYGLPGRQVARFSLRDDRTMFLFVVADRAAHGADPHDAHAHRRYLTERFSGAGWECDQILSALRAADNLYFDRVSQIRMDRWSRGRVALVGDAAYAPSLLAGQGAALAIVGAFVLAGELGASSRVEAALGRYEALLQPFMLDKQKAAGNFGKFFAPRTRLGISIRKWAMRGIAVSFVQQLALRSSLLDRITLPAYDDPSAPDRRVGANPE